MVVAVVGWVVDTAVAGGVEADVGCVVGTDVRSDVVGMVVATGSEPVQPEIINNISTIKNATNLFIVIMPPSYCTTEYFFYIISHWLWFVQIIIRYLQSFHKHSNIKSPPHSC